ncbi:hypothetical protein [Pontibacter saemangeumensis]|uniref:hypothetical protein n=1 Tax=Pontibacter saemangeumensis TaxID=1084525 RepID=UPI0031E97C8D
MAIASFTQPIHAQAPDLLYSKGVNEFSKGRTAEAIIIFEEVLAHGYESAALYNNLGSAYLQEDKIGQAILNYEKALLISPQNPQIQNNASVARNKTKFVQQPEDVISRLSKLVSLAFTVDDLAILGLTMLVLGLCLMALHLYAGRMSLKVISAGLMLAAVFTLAVATLQLYLHSNTSKAVVIKQKIVVKKSASLQAKDAFTLYEGTIVNVQDNFEGWYKISWTKDDKGWVQMKTIKKIKTLDAL